MGVFDMWGDSSCSYPYPEIFCNQLCFKVEYFIVAFSLFLLPKFVCLIGLNKLINYFIKHWLLSIIFGLRTALVTIRPIIVYFNPEQDRQAAVINPSGKYRNSKCDIIRPMRKKKVKRIKKS